MSCAANRAPTPTVPTKGRWAPIVRGKGTRSEKVTGWLEVFKASGTWVSVPGASRFIEVRP